MRKITVILLLIFLSSNVFHSMALSRENLNQRFTEKTVRKLCKKTGNAFYITSNYADFSIVWTYFDSRIEIYKLKNGKIIQNQTFEDQCNALYDFDFADLENELYSICPVELDGDLLGIQIEHSGIKYKSELPVSINDLKRGIYNVELLNKIADDIQRYDLWAIE